MLGTLLLMNDTIGLAVRATISMALHWAMMFRCSLSGTRHSVDFGCRFVLLFRVGTRLLSQMCDTDGV